MVESTKTKQKHQMKKSDIIQTGNFRLPKDRYKCAVKEAKGGRSKKNNYMITLTCEICEPDEVVDRVTGERYSVAGKEFTMYVVHTAKSAESILKFRHKLDLPAEEVLVDDEIIDGQNEPNASEYVNKTFAAILEGEEIKARYDAKPGQDYGDEILDEDGNPTVTGYRINAGLNSVVGPAKLTRPRAF